jgi:predicted TIM-barrel fold metal-dependent hydrolase
MAQTSVQEQVQRSSLQNSSPTQIPKISRLITTGIFCFCALTRAAEYNPPTVIIDAHTHLFNSHYLPIREIVRAQTEVPRFLASGIEKILWAVTPDSDLGGTNRFGALAVPALDRPAADRLVRLSKTKSADEARKILVEEVFRPMMVRVLTVLNSDEIRAIKNYVGGAIKSLDDNSLTPEEIVYVFEKMPLMEDQHNAPRPEAINILGNLKFVGIVTSDERALFMGLKSTYPKVILFVHHMMDLGATYNETPEFPFGTQVTKMLALQNENPSHILTFGAFDPFRRAAAFELATNAYAKGVIGFKFYPPDGYRPAGNQIPPKSMPGTVPEQWDSRYKGIFPTNIDNWNEQLFAFCESKDIPIFLHCSPGGFEAVKGYGLLMADPAYWTDVLAKHQNLRVCFGHSGGNDYWFGLNEDTNSAQFSQTLVKLCETYPNIYCDSAYWEHLLTAKGVEALETELPIAVLKHPKLAKKLIYGSDWYMVSREENYDEYLSRMITALCHPQENVPNWNQFISDFFAGNEARYLQLDKLTKDERLEPTVRKELKGLVNRLPPRWDRR